MTGEPLRRRSIRARMELPILIVVAALVAFAARTYVMQTFYIPSGSMERTLLIDDQVLVNKLVFRFRDPARGEIVVFKAPAAWSPDPGSEDYIKRIVGIGGDRVVCCDAQHRLTVNGVSLDEDYLFPGDKPSKVAFDVTVPPGRVFVLGDHRSGSADSRFHLNASGGTVPVDRIVGRAFVLFWPFGHARSLEAPDVYASIPKPQ